MNYNHNKKSAPGRKRMPSRMSLGALAMLMALAMSGLVSCSKSQSYSELLRDEEKAVNWFLAQKKVELEIPADSISFKTGENAPFYKLDEDGYVYMQVISKGDMDDRAESGDLVYFRFSRQNINYLYTGVSDSWSGNSENLASGLSTFVYKNLTLQSSAQYGTGIQMPLKFFGYNSEVNLVLKSYYGFTSDQTTCTPYIINVRYFKPEY